MKIPFSKYHGTGNDFVIIDQTEDEYITSEQNELIASICHRRYGIGADGLMLIQRHPEADFEMIYFNSDGRTSSMCGNGGRCIASMAYRLGMLGESATFMAIDGIHEVQILDPQLVSLKMSDVGSITPTNDDFTLDTGSPHFIRLVDDVNILDVYSEGKRVRNSEAYQAEGINVNFVEQRGGTIAVRTYERGVEDETFSCGTGVVASAIVHAATSKEPLEQVDIRTKGGKLSVHFTKSENGYEDIWLTGPAVHVFDGFFRTS